MLATLLPPAAHTEGAEADSISSNNHRTQRRPFQESAIRVACWKSICQKSDSVDSFHLILSEHMCNESLHSLEVLSYGAVHSRPLS